MLKAFIYKDFSVTLFYIFKYIFNKRALKNRLIINHTFNIYQIIRCEELN